MKTRLLRSLFCLSLLVWSLLCLTGPALAASLYDVTISLTAPLSGTDARMVFDFTNGDAVVNNIASVTLFSADGTLLGATNTGGASGNLPGTLTLNDTAFMNQSTRDMTFGSSITFRLALSEQFGGGSPDAFAFYLLDTLTGTTPVVETDDPTGANALFALDLDGSVGGALSVFNPSTAGIHYSVSAVTAVPELKAVALPAFLLLFGGLLWRRSSQKGRPRA